MFLKLASILLVVSTVKAGVISNLGYTSAYTSPIHYSSSYLARSAPLIANSIYTPSVYHAHAHAPATIVKSAPIIAPAPVFAKTILPAAAPVIAAKTIVQPAPVLAKTIVPAAPVVAVKATDEFDVHPQYKYAYNVNDALTGDNKAQEEIRDGDVVKGYYTFLEADGTTRTVNYYADPINGFNAQVTKSAPVVAAAPAIVEPAKIVVA